MNLTGRPIYQKPTKEDIKDDLRYLSYLRTLPSAISGLKPSLPAHYRTADNSGTGTKPLFSAIPLTDSEHKEQHRIGQYNFMPRDWWEEQVSKHLKMWREL